MKANIPSSGERRRSTRQIPPDIQPEREVESASGASDRNRPRASRMNRIAERAHEIYQNRGGGDGRALEDWLQAEREIDAES